MLTAQALNAYAIHYKQKSVEFPEEWHPDLIKQTKLKARSGNYRLLTLFPPLSFQPQTPCEFHLKIPTESLLTQNTLTET